MTPAGQVPIELTFYNRPGDVFVTRTAGVALRARWFYGESTRDAMERSPTNLSLVFDVPRRME